MPCPVCGYQNPEGTAKCGACGTQLIAEPRPAARPGDAVCANHKDIPALQPCARCGTFYCGACLERSTDGQMYCAQCRSRSSLPWDQRDELGVLRAWFQTCTKLMLEPTATLANAARDGSIGSSLLFALISSVAGVATTLLLCVPAYGSLIFGAMSKARELNGESAAPAIGIGLIGGIAIFLVYFVMFMGVQIVSVFLLAALEHLVLHLSGERDLGPYTATVRAHALGLAPFVLGFIPGCGMAVMGFWSLVLRCITLMTLQKVSAGKAVAAVLSPVLLICGCVGLSYFFLIAAVLSAAGLGR